MSFNALIKEEDAVNHEGTKTFRMSPEMALYTAAVTFALSEKFYESSQETVERVSQLVAKCDPLFVAQLAIYARTQMNLRSVPLLLVVELCRHHSGDDLVSRAVSKIVLRADEIAELLMCYQWRNPVPGNQMKKLNRLSRQIQNGLKLSFNRFDEYQFAKYNRSDRTVKLRDALFLVHPKAKDEAQQALFNKIASESLETPYTWEVQLSVLGQRTFESEEEKMMAIRTLWEKLLDSGRVGYMALLRNLRNIIQADVSTTHMEKLCQLLSDPVQVEKSRQMPFRFLSAYEELLSVNSVHTAKFLSALERAVKWTVANMQGFDADTRVLVAADVSGSMFCTVSPKSVVRHFDIGVLLSMLLKMKCNSVISGIFGDIWKTVNLPQEGILANTIEMRRREGEVGYSTNGHKVIDYLYSQQIGIDKVMIFTDCQMWNSDEEGIGGEQKNIRRSWHRYKSFCPESKLYLFDLAGYGQSPLSLAEKDVYLIGGWSEKVFDILYAIDNGSDAIAKIREIEV